MKREPFQPPEAPADVDVSVVIPVYKSGEIFPELSRQLVQALEAGGYTFDIIAVVDGPLDDTFDIVAALAEADPRVKALELSRNFGHQAAVTAGLAHASGRVVGVMDDDLEDPPSVLVEMLGKLEEGYDVVYGVRRTRRRSLLYRLLYRLFYRVFGALTDIDMPHDAGDFCVMRRPVADLLNRMPENNRYLRGMRAWAGFRQTGWAYDRGERAGGSSGYSLRKYLALALDAVFAFSYKPLEYVSRLGLVIALTSFAYGSYLVIVKLLGFGPDVPGWVSLLVAVLMLSGVQLISIGILGQYLKRIYDEVKDRPKFVVGRSTAWKEGGDDAP